MLSVILLSLWARAFVKCDSQNQFKDFILPSQKQVSLAQQMIDESKAQQKAIDKLTQAKTKNAYGVYMNSEAGKKSAARIEGLKGQLNYDAVSYYLFDNPSFNADIEAYDAKEIREGKTYFFRKGQIIAVLESEMKTWILRRYDKDCRQKEAVGFASLDVADESHLDYKINPQFCALKGAKPVSSLSEEQIESVRALVNSTVDSAEALRLRSRQIEAQCRQMAIPALKGKPSETKPVKTSS